MKKRGYPDGAMSKLPVYVDDVSRISCWKCRSIVARIYFLFTGKIWLQTVGNCQPIVGMGIGKMFTFVIKR
jgi:hypothetical protein